LTLLGFPGLKAQDPAHGPGTSPGFSSLDLYSQRTRFGMEHGFLNYIQKEKTEKNKNRKNKFRVN